MEVKVLAAAAASCVSSPFRSQTLASANLRLYSYSNVVFARHLQRLDRSGNLQCSRFCGHRRFRARNLRRACSAGYAASFSEEEFSKKIQEPALKFQFSDDDGDGSEDFTTSNTILGEEDEKVDGSLKSQFRSSGFLQDPMSFNPLKPPDFPVSEDMIMIPANIERKANSIEIPRSLSIIRRKKQWQDGFREAGESAYCSVKRAFSSMVFIIRELHSFTLQMREALIYEDLQGILDRVHREMHASFVWLFQQVFSHTPTLMVYVMILLANYSVYSMDANAAAINNGKGNVATTESVSVVEDYNVKNSFDSSSVKTFKLSSSNGRTTSVGGINGGGGGKYRPIAGGTDDGRFEESNHHSTIVPDGASSIGKLSRTIEDEAISGQVSREEEVKFWNSIVEEASRMEAVSGNAALDQDTKERFVSPVDARIEADDYAEFLKTELSYQTGLAQEPNNPLLLANYGQFLYLVAQDFDRAEDYFKKAVETEPKDAEALNKYADFLWKVRNDLWAAEETYLEAIVMEPSNSYYAANYAHFLWNTGGEDTCFPLSSPDTTTDI